MSNLKQIRLEEMNKKEIEDLRKWFKKRFPNCSFKEFLNKLKHKEVLKE